jgi:CelD/BcsL family acetyltransferase involved in cellulose biosynthesis
MAEEHFYASEAFLRALADGHFPGAKPTVVTCEGFTTRTLVHGGRPVTGFWHYPYYHPRIEDTGAAPLRVPGLQRAEIAVTPMDGDPVAGAQRAMFIDWRGFSSWAEYERHAAARGMRTTSLDRDQGYLERDIGKVRFVWDDPDPATFEAVIQLKRADYARRNGIDRLNTRQNLEFHRMLVRRGLMTVSSLRAGDRVVAAQFAHVWGRRTVYWITTYDYALRRYSPGALQMRYFLRHRFEAGDEELDFLWGEEPYKFRYATHARWLGAVGSEPRFDRLRRRARMRAGRVLRRYPAVYSPVQRLERAVRASAGRLRR